MNCSLCEEVVSAFEIQSESLFFCCHGCLAVYKILESQKQLDRKKDHPLIAQALQFGLISNPTLLEKIQKKEVSEKTFRKKWVFEVGKMWCPSCADFIRLVLIQQKGIFRCAIDYVTDLGTIEFDPQVFSKETIHKMIENLGYSVNELTDHQGTKDHSILTRQFAVVSFCALNIMMFAYPLYTTYFSIENEGMRPILSWISFGLTLPVLFYARNIFKRTGIQLKQGILGMEALVSGGVSAALIISLYEMLIGTFHIYFDTITVLIAFLLLGKIMESKAKFSTKEALLRLHHALPRKGRKRGSNQFVPLKDIEVGDEIVAYAGERIVIDGCIIEGEGACDESVITGESIPLYKQKGDLVLSGSILQNGHLCYRVTARNESSTLHHILRLVENEIGHKSHYIRAADRIVKWFTPLVLSIAFFTFMGTFSLGFLEAASRSMAILLIACPCAIGIAAPLIESKILQRFTEKGALVRNRALLAKLSHLTHFVFDKTGTITEGKFKVLSGLEHLCPEDKMRLKSLASHSLHPIAKAIDSELDVPFWPFSKIQEVPGKGMIGDNYCLGSARFLKEQGILAPNDSASYFACEDGLISRIILGDSIKKESKQLLHQLKSFQRILLSGDHQSNVDQVAEEIEFDAWYGEKTPLEKQSFISELKDRGAVVAMLGDGINDAPALAKADVGISVVSASDISIQVSDLLLTTGSLQVIPDLIQLAIKGQRLIRQNLFWAFFYNVIGIGLAVFGVLTPLFASFAMIVSSLIVLFNSKRV